MKPNKTLSRGFVALFSLMMMLGATGVHAAARQWIPAGGGSWNTPANWSGGAVPVAGDTADFSNVNLTADAIVTLDANQTVDGITFGDTNTATAGSWIIRAGALPGATLTLTGTATVTVNALGAGKVAKLESILAGTAGLTKAGVGVLELAEFQSYTGATNVNAGTLRMGRAAAPTSSVVTGSAVWLDASDASTITLAGSAVSQWRDKSGNVRHAAQATAANQPTLRTAAQNGLNTIRFDGTDDFLGIDLTFLVGSQYTVFVVEGRNSTKTESYFLGTETGSANQGLHLGYRDNDTFTQAQFGNDTNYDSAALSFTGTQDYRTWTMRNNAAERRIYLGENSVASNTATALMTAALNGTVGRGYGGARYYQGDISELIIYNSTLSDADRRNVQRYLSGKWLGATDVALLPTGTAVTVAAGATLDLGGINQTIGSLAGAGSVLMGAGTLSTGGNNTSTIFSGNISGAGGLIKNGSGLWTLSGTNSYDGATSINAGSVKVTANQALGTATGNTTVTGGTALIFENANYTTAEPLVMNAGNNNGSSRIETLGGPSTFAGPITINCTPQFIVRDAGLTLSGVISGSHGIIKQGDGTLTLQGASTYTGLTAIHAGVIRLSGGANRLPVSTTVILGTESTGGQLDLNNQSQQLAGLVDARNQRTAATSSAPNTVPGLLYWLDASDASTFTLNGSTVSQWRDKSGNARHFNQATAAAQPALVAGALGGQPAVRFDGVDDQITLATATSPVTVFLVNRMADNAQNIAGIWGSSNPGDKGIRREGQTSRWNSSDGNDFTQAERLMYINGVLGTSFGNTGTSHVLTAIRGGQFAAGAATFNNTQLGFYFAGRIFAGDIAEVVVYDRALSDAERRSVESFLSAKWNVSVASVVDSANDAVIPDLNVSVTAGVTNAFSGSLGLPGMAGFSFTKSGAGIFELANAATHTGGTNIVAGVLRLANNTAATTLPVTTGLQQHFDANDPATFSPAITPITATAPNLLAGGGLALWLDASVAGSITSAAGKVSQWNDQSGNGRNFTQATGTNQPNYVAADNRIDGSNTLFLDHSATQILTGATGATLFVVGKHSDTTTTGGGWGKFSGQTNDVHTPWRDDSKIYENFASTSRPDLGFVGVRPGSRFLYGALQDGTGLTGFFNSTVSRNKVAATFAIPTTAQQRIFGQNSTFSMHEVIVFNRALSDAERKQIEQYLANKWSIPLAAPGPNIASWTSRTGADATKDLTQATAANQPTYIPSSANFGGKPVVYFDGNDVISNTQSFAAGDSTVVTVQRLTRAQNARLVTARSNNWLLGYHGGLEDRFHPNGWVSPSGGQPTPSGLAKIYTSINDAGTNSFWSGFTLLAGNANGTQGPNGLSLGAQSNNPATEPSQGEVAEIVVYDRKLSAAELRQVVDYLNAKWLTAPASTRGSLDDAGVVAISAGATLDLNSLNETVGPLTGATGSAVTLGSATLTVNSVANSTFAGGISGTGGLVKQGAGVLTLAAASTYSGGTSVTAGELSLTNTSGSATGSGSLTFAAGTTLSGTGTASGVATMTGATVNPGVGGVGTLSLGGLTVDSATVFNVDLGSVSDQIVLAGALTVDGTVNVTPASGFAFGAFTIITYGGALTDNTAALGTTPPGYTPSIVSGGGQVVLILAAPTTLTLSANPVSPTVFSQPMSFSATVAPVAPAVGVPAGIVNFTVDGVAQPPVALINGIATLNIASLAVGTHTIAATFSISPTTGASSDSIQHEVIKANSTVLVLSSSNPSPDGNGILSALVNPVAPAVGTPTGSVIFSLNGTVSGTGLLVNGVATFTLPGLPSGLYLVTAAYSGDAGFQPNSGTLSQVVSPRFISSPVLTPNPSIVGQTIQGISDSGSLATTTWLWGDGSSSTGATATHSYSTTGIYTVLVTVSIPNGASTTFTQQAFVGLGFDGPGGNGGATPPGVTGILVGGSGAGAAQGGSGKIVCNYVRRDKTTYMGSLGMLNIPATLTQESLLNLPSTLLIGAGANVSTFRFDLNKSGKGKATGLPSVEFSIKKKRFKFKAQREDLTALTEVLGGPQEFAFRTKQPPVTLLVPVSLQIGDKVFLAMTFQVTYKQISSGGKGGLVK